MGTLTAKQRHQTVESMERHGGGFLRRIAQAWYVADSRNRRRLEMAFSHELQDFMPGGPFYDFED